MVDPEIVTEWLERAKDDLEFARINLEEKRPYFAQICFHFQQSAEKFLKAFIVAHGLEFRKTHDLLSLLTTCKAKDKSFEQLRDKCEFLNTFYVETRYPVHWPTKFSREEAEKCLKAAETIQAHVEERLGKTSR